MEEFCAASDAVFAAERSLAAHIGQAHAVPLHFPLRWDFGGGAPLPCLLSNDRKTFLVFRVAGAAPNVAMVEFKRCVCLKTGTPNDEVYEGHSLHGKGLEPYRPLRVINSPWIKELEAINSVHQQYRPEHWQDFQHYIFGFKDQTFECVAESFVVEEIAAGIETALANIFSQMGLP